jgi:S1-C subfamily serine protease
VHRLDAVALVGIVLSAIVGWRLGLIHRVIAWAGLVGGIWLGTTLLPHIPGIYRSGPSDPGRFLVAAGIVVVCGMVGQFAGNWVGAYLGNLVQTRGINRLDRLGGVAAGVVGALFVVWVLGPVMARVPGWPAAEARRSVTLQALTKTLGSPPNAFSGVEQALGLDRLPEVFDQLAPSPKVAPPPAGNPLPGAVQSLAEQATVRVFGPGCGGTVSGSGFVVDSDLVVTNAHVVAGTHNLGVDGPGMARKKASVVLFDPGADLALVRVPGLGRQPLTLAAAQPQDVGAALGYPLGGPLSTMPYRVERRVDARGKDIYGRAVTRRDVLILSARLTQGDSGGPLVDTQGRVAGVVFAVAPDQPTTGYALATSEVTALLAKPRTTEPVLTGDCPN